MSSRPSANEIFMDQLPNQSRDRRRQCSASTHGEGEGQRGADQEGQDQSPSPTLLASSRPSSEKAKLETRLVRQSLRTRHVSFISLAGAIGGGLFLSTGSTLAHAGPISLLVGYAIMSSVVISVVFCMAELSCLVPTTGAYIRHAAMFVDPALGFTIGWSIVFADAVANPAGIVSLIVLCQYWAPDLDAALPVCFFVLASLVTNIWDVRVYAELESFFAMLKILTVIGLNILSLCVALGAGRHGKTVGFRYWTEPAPFKAYLVDGPIGQFIGFWSVMVSAVYSYSGIEATSFIAAETRSPRQVIARASKGDFFRIGFIYMCSLFFLSMAVPSTEPRLTSQEGNALASPFVIAANRVGITGIASIVNALILLSVFSSNNTCLLAASRALMGLALDGHAPRFFAETHRWGIPMWGVLVCAAFMPLAFTVYSQEASIVFEYFVSIGASGTLMEWIVICWTTVRLHSGMREQGISQESLPFCPWGQPWLAWYGLVMSVLCAVTNGFTLFIGEGLPRLTAQRLISAYAMPIITILLYLAFKIIRRTRFNQSRDMRIRPWLDQWKENPEQWIEPARGWGRLLSLLWSHD